MGDFLIIYQIALPEGQDADAFVAFMRDEYLPAVHKGPTRVGQVTSLALLQGVAETHETTRTFYLHMGFDGLASGDARVDDEGVERKFKAFGARVERLGACSEVAEWTQAVGA